MLSFPLSLPHMVLSSHHSDGLVPAAAFPVCSLQFFLSSHGPPDITHIHGLHLHLQVDDFPCPSPGVLQGPLPVASSYPDTLLASPLGLSEMEQNHKSALCLLLPLPCPPPLIRDQTLLQNSLSTSLYSVIKYSPSNYRKRIYVQCRKLGKHKEKSHLQYPLTSGYTSFQGSPSPC